MEINWNELKFGQCSYLDLIWGFKSGKFIFSHAHFMHLFHHAFGGFIPSFLLCICPFFRLNALNAFDALNQSIPSNVGPFVQYNYKQSERGNFMHSLLPPKKTHPTQPTYTTVPVRLKFGLAAILIFAPNIFCNLLIKQFGPSYIHIL